MGTCVSRNPAVVEGGNTAEMETIKRKFMALADVRSEEGYILKEDFFKFFNLPGLLGERLFNMFDENRDEKIFWTEFKNGVKMCMYGADQDIDDFIFHFFDLSDDNAIDFKEFQSIMNHLPPSIFSVVMKSAENRSEEVHSWLSSYSLKMNDLPTEAFQEGIKVLVTAYFSDESEERIRISYHDFSVFLSEQMYLRNYFKAIFNVTSRNVAFNGNIITSNYNTFINTTKMSRTESYKAIPFGMDAIAPDVYKTRSDRAIAKQGRDEKWKSFTRAYWSITCSFCGKEIRFCPYCQGELQPLSEATKSKEDQLMKKLQCNECNRVIMMRFCTSCGHQFKEDEINVRMEVPGVNAEVKEHEGELYQIGAFNRKKKVFARIYNQFFYIYNSVYSETPSSVIFLEKAGVVSVESGAGKPSGYYGFCIQLPALYDQEFYCTNRGDVEEWIQAIKDVTDIRKIEDFYDIREKIGEGKFAVVYRCVDKNTLQEYAVKVINKKKMNEKESSLIQTEIAILNLVHHKNIVELIDTFEEKDNIYIVMELLKGGELFDRICGRSILSEEEAFQIIYPLADCLSYLHRMGIIHRDIKPENILCKSNLYDVKIGDFGLSKLVFPDEKLDYPCGTLNYIAPEVISRQGYTTKADMWSLGVIFYLLLRGRLPFDGNKQEDIIKAIVTSTPDYNNTAFLNLSYNCREAIKGLLQKNPDMRLSADDLLHHPWVADMKNRQKTVPYKAKPSPMERITSQREKENSSGSNDEVSEPQRASPKETSEQRKADD